MSEPLHEIKSTRSGHALIVEVVGEIDLGTSGELESALLAAPGDAGRVVVDLAGVTFLDSSALNALIRQEKRLAAHGTELTLVIPAGTPAQAIFELTHLSGTFAIVPTVDQAVA